MRDLAAALLEKERLIDRLDNYYYTVQVEVKTRNRVCGVVVEPSREWVTETRFKWDEWNKDLNAVNNKISLEFNNLAKASQIAETTIVENQKLQICLQKAGELKSITDSITSQISTEQNRTKEAIKSLNPVQKAHLIAEVIGEPRLEFIMNACSGFDIKSLAYFALKNQNLKLLDFVIKQDKTIFDTTITDGQTLLQIAQQKFFLAKILILSKECTYTCIKAVAENDLATIQVIGQHDPNILALEILGDMTLLHLAISNNSAQMCQLLTSLNPGLAALKNANGDSSLKLALRSSDDSTLRIIASLVTIDHTELEIPLLKRAHDLGLLQLTEAPIDTMELELSAIGITDAIIK